MKLFLRIAAVILALAVAPAWAGDGGTPDEAKAMAIKAAAYIKEVGPEKAFAAFNAKDGPWHDRDLYVFVLDDKVMTLANGNNLALVGKSTASLKDVDGKPFTQEFVAVKDAAWVDYKWQNPVTKMVAPKTAYVVRVDEYTVGVGAYK